MSETLEIVNRIIKINYANQDALLLNYFLPNVLNPQYKFGWVII